MLKRRALAGLILAIAAGMGSGAAQERGTPGSTLAERYLRAQEQLEELRANEDATRAERDRLATETNSLQDRLVANAAKVQELESAYDTSAADLAGLNDEIARFQADFDRDRDRVAHLLAVLQRLQTDLPPALVLKPGDSLAAARGTMQMGAMLPPVYRQAAELAARLKSLSRTKTALAAKTAQSQTQFKALSAARIALDSLLREKRAGQSKAEAKLVELHEITEQIGQETTDLRALIERIATLRSGAAPAPGMVVVAPRRTADGSLTRGSLRLPVAGKSMPGDPAGPGRTPGANGPLGMWFEASGGAEAVAPGDSEVVFAGNYQKFGQVLILELPGGYHLTLAGFGRIDVQLGDLVLAGEPVGILTEGKAARLYMELRRNGQALDPAPWLGAELRKAKGT